MPSGGLNTMMRFCSTAPRSTVQCSAVQCSTVQRDTAAQLSGTTAQHTISQRSSQHDTAAQQSGSTAQHSTAHHNAAQHSTAQHDACRLRRLAGVCRRAAIMPPPLHRLGGKCMRVRCADNLCPIASSAGLQWSIQACAASAGACNTSACHQRPHPANCCLRCLRCLPACLRCLPAVPAGRGARTWSKHESLTTLQPYSCSPVTFKAAGAHAPSASSSPADR